jgi:hypothetical protein
MTVSQFVIRHSARIVFGAMLTLVLVGLIYLWLPHYRERGIARTLRNRGAHVAFLYFGPTWIPLTVQDRIPAMSRVTLVTLSGQTISPDLIFELRQLANPTSLSLDNTRITDADVERLANLKNLELLDLRHTEVTDAGLKHLKGLSKLRYLLVDSRESGRRRATAARLSDRV